MTVKEGIPAMDASVHKFMSMVKLCFVGITGIFSVVASLICDFSSLR